MSKTLDEAGAVRDGEELNLNTVDPFIKQHVDGLSGTPTVRQFSGGASNLTYLLQYPERDLILRRPPFGKKAKSAHDMLREARIMDRLKPVFGQVPDVLATCEDPAVLDCEFYVMERLHGIIPRKNLPRDLHLTTDETRQLCTHVVDTLIDLHQVDVQAAGLDDIGKGEGYVRRQIEGWTERYARAKTWNVLPMKRVTRWLAERIPSEESICLIHNDFRFDNVVLDADNPMKVIGVLDWEMATLGDPLMDLGSSLAYWIEAGDDRFAQSMRRQPTHLPGMFTRQQLIDYYLERTGRQHVDFDFYEVYGLFRLAAIAQQIYYRYHHGQTRNPAFKGLWMGVNYLGWRCGQIIRRSKH